jgi:paraquat-inducible protein B
MPNPPMADNDTTPAPPPSPRPPPPPVPPPSPDLVPLPQVRRSRWSVSLVWLVPAVALLLGLSMVVQAWRATGPRIEIAFQTAEGLEAGKTQVRFKNVVIGSVKAIRLAPDRSQVLVTVNLAKEAASFASADTRFWVVRPRVGATGVSGIDTLLSGAFIGADAGKSLDTQSSFVGLETPPAITYGAAGRQFALRADDLGSLDIGSPVYHRRVQVGRVVSAGLDKDGRGVSLQVFIEAPHDRLVTRSTRFWNASGVDVTVGANGLKVDTQSLAAVLAGGIAFQMPPGLWDSKPAPDNTVYTLSPDQKTALTPPDGDPLFFTMRFDQSMRGLAVDAPVEFHGIDFGKVVAINVDYDADKKTFPTVVGAVVYPRRLGLAYDKLQPPGAGPEQQARVMAELVARGLRAQPRTGNLLTGQLYIALDFVPNAKKVAFDEQAVPMDVPTVPGALDKLQEQLAGIVERVEKIPFESIGTRLDGNLASLDRTLERVNADVLPQAQQTLKSLEQTLGDVRTTVNAAGGTLAEDGALQLGLAQTLKDLQRAAASMRGLTDYLSRHPESLLRGRPQGGALPDDKAAVPAAPAGSAPATGTSR